MRSSTRRRTATSSRRRADPSALDAVILCGGKGLRLRPVTGKRQKVLAEVAGEPFLRFLVEHLAARGLARFILCAGYRAADVAATAERLAAELGVEIAVSREPKPLGTAGALRHALKLIRSDAVFVANGDTLCEVEPAAMLAQHRRRRSLATLALVPAGPRRDGGFVRLDGRGRVLAFAEREYDAAHSFFNAGFYLFQRRAIERIPVGKKLSLEQDLFPGLVRERLHGFVIPGPIFDIGTPARLALFRRWLRRATGARS